MCLVRTPALQIVICIDIDVFVCVSLVFKSNVREELNV